MVNFTDAEGSPCSTGRYDCIEHPQYPINAFWSLAATATKDMNLIPNAADLGEPHPLCMGTEMAGSAICGRTGSRTGCPPNSSWLAILRMYRPHPYVIAASWKCPGSRWG